MIIKLDEKYGEDPNLGSTTHSLLINIESAVDDLNKLKDYVLSSEDISEKEVDGLLKSIRSSIKSISDINKIKGYGDPQSGNEPEVSEMLYKLKIAKDGISKYSEDRFVQSYLDFMKNPALNTDRDIRNMYNKVYRWLLNRKISTYGDLNDALRAFGISTN